MVKKILLVLILVALPISVHAETSSLGPATGGTGTSDPGTAAVLQPAPAGLQDGASQLQQPLGQSGIQQPASREQVDQYLSGELGGPSVSTPETESEPSQLPLALIFAGLFVMGFAFSLVYDRKSASHPNESVPLEPKPVAVSTRKAPKKTKTTKKKTSRPRKSSAK